MFHNSYLSLIHHMKHSILCPLLCHLSYHASVCLSDWNAFKEIENLYFYQEVLRGKTLLITLMIFVDWEIVFRCCAWIIPHLAGPLNPFIWNPFVTESNGTSKMEYSGKKLKKFRNFQFNIAFRTKLFFFGWGRGVVCFSDPPALPNVPEAGFNVRQTHSLSSLTFKRVTRGSAITNTFPLHPVTQGTWRCDQVPGANQ